MKKCNLFDKRLDITTNNDKFVIENKQILIHGLFSFDGDVYVMNKINDLSNDVYIIREIYSYDDNRLRYAYDVYLNAKSFNTIEKLEEGKENPIMVIESYDELKTYIGSIGNIKELISDKQIHNHKQDKNKILALLRKNKEEQKVA